MCSSRVFRRLATVTALTLGLAGLAPGYFEDIDTPSSHSTFHYEMMRVLARAAGFSAEQAELIAVADAAVDLGTYTGDSAASPTVQVTGTSRFEDTQAKYFHFPRRKPTNGAGQDFPGGRDTCANFVTSSDPCPTGTAEANELEAWAVLGTGSPSGGTPETSVNGAALAPTQGRTLVGLSIYLHSLADSYSHEKCGEAAQSRRHYVSPPSCTAEIWHGQMEYGADAGGVSYTREAGYAMWQELKHFRQQNGFTGAALWDDATAFAFVDGWVVLNRAADRQSNANQAYASLPSCTVTCDAVVPETAPTGTSVSFQATATTPGCDGTPTWEWDFGDGSAPSTQANAAHAYAAAGPFTWRLTVRSGGQSCTDEGTITILPACQPPQVTGFSTNVPSPALGSVVTVQAIATGTVPVSFAWFEGSTGDTIRPIACGSGQSCTLAPLAGTTHVWAHATNACGQADSPTLTITVNVVYSRLYLVPSVAHLPGSGGSNWRTDVALVNRSAAEAALALTWVDHDTGSTLAATSSLAAGATVEWKDVLVGIFKLGTAEKKKGILRIASTQPLAVTSRTYNQASVTATYGQYYPALEAADAIAAGQVGVLPQLKKNTAFRTNLGVVNLGTSSCSVLVKLFDATGKQAGGSRTMTVEVQRWKQQDDIFGNVGAGNRDLAYATVEVQTSGGKVWAYASIVDNTTGDPTTIPVRVPE